MLGAWVAGFRAGYVSNSWPDMNGHFVPEGIDWSHGAAFALTHDLFLLHFMHRWWAWVVVAVLVLFARKVRKVDGARPASIAIHSAFGTQILLGILTVLSGIAIWLAVLHQATGALLLAATVWGAHELGRRLSVVSLYVVFANAEEAERIGRAVVEERLAAVHQHPRRRSDQSTAGRRRSRRPTKSPPSSRRSMPRRRADHAHRRAAQL